ncbi:hypothetical protein QFC20_002602 [Naganishia adeliensis]|uniref:Uncharacterized protein n=1 Tax=Naganishia adeliensis TaxID=92952 RepID=A0ACC2WKH3_9TREE|nr:hypothetical protein QFC20_002602 [Naganishia adeliensis]
MERSTSSLPPESVLTANNANQSSSQRPQSRAPTKGEEKLNAIIIENIPVFCCGWRGHVLLRRIDSDYVNITTLCRALQATHVQAEFQRLAGVAVVEGNTNEMLNGIWVHLALVAEWAEVLGIPDEVVNGLLAIDLANRDKEASVLRSVIASTDPKPPLTAFQDT